MEPDFIAQWSRTLSVSRRKRKAIARELRTHLTEVQQELKLAGWRQEDAEQESFRRLGDPREMTEAFSQVYRRPRRVQIGMAFLLASGLLVGAYSAGGTLASATSVHSRPAHTTHVVHAKHCSNRARHQI